MLRWSAAALIAIAPAAHAAGDSSGYLLLQSNQPVHTGGSGGCVHASEWRHGMHLGDCDPLPPAPAAVTPRPEPVPEPVVEAPKPVAQPMPPPVPFRLSADTLFDYDSTNLKPEGRAALDALADQIAHATYQTINVTGHADRLGTASYNRSLSERRAQVVGAYLTGHGIDASKIATHGVGSNEPVTAPEQCAHQRGQQLIDCLRPDRFAEVSVTGTAQQAAAATGDAQ